MKPKAPMGNVPALFDRYAPPPTHSWWTNPETFRQAVAENQARLRNSRYGSTDLLTTARNVERQPKQPTKVDPMT